MAASAAHIMAVIADFPSYPQWAGSVKQADVVETYSDGTVRQVRFRIDAGIVKDDYTLAYQWSPDGSGVSWSLLESKVMRSQEGGYDLVEQDGMTQVTYTLAVETSVPMLGLLRRRGEKMIMDIALKELKKRVER